FTLHGHQPARLTAPRAERGLEVGAVPARRVGAAVEPLVVGAGEMPEAAEAGRARGLEERGERGRMRGDGRLDDHGRGAPPLPRAKPPCFVWGGDLGAPPSMPERGERGAICSQAWPTAKSRSSWSAGAMRCSPTGSGAPPSGGTASPQGTLIAGMPA